MFAGSVTPPEAQVVRIVSWNIGRRTEAWHFLLQDRVDLALLQEAVPPPAELDGRFFLDAWPWETPSLGSSRPWRTAVVGCSDRVRLTPRPTVPLDRAQGDELGVSRPGTIALADVELISGNEVLAVASLYGLWEVPVPAARSSWIYADAAVHRLVSDLSALVGRQDPPPLLLAGDLNILHGYGEQGSAYWRARYDSVFARLSALGLDLVGPQAPGGGMQAAPWPAELPAGSRNVPTFRTRPRDAGSATRQLDFVFASPGLRPRLRARAMNAEDEWGPSDHCRILIELDARDALPGQ